ncbi:MAG: GNAT family N-acetyltransferase [Proteobacteria bacterium]|nr:GNAT family N-acetyltransferase [Pseudomonadota bacterium]
MSAEISDVNGLVCLESGSLPVRGDHYSLVLLQTQHIDAIKTLHETVIERLPDDQKSFVLARPESYFHAHFARSISVAMGVVCNSNLVAKCLIVHPRAGETAADLGGAILHSAPEQTSIMQSATVHPDFRGNGIMNMMIRHWLNHAVRHGRMHVLAEIETRNKQSWSQFLKAGLNIIGAHKSPVDGASVYNAGERIKLTLAKDFTSATQAPDSDATGNCVIMAVNKPTDKLKATPLH